MFEGEGFEWKRREDVVVEGEEGQQQNRPIEKHKKQDGIGRKEIECPFHGSAPPTAHRAETYKPEEKTNEQGDGCHHEKRQGRAQWSVILPAEQGLYGVADHVTA